MIFIISNYSILKRIAINQEKQAAQAELDYWTQVQQARSQSGVSNAEVNEIVNETSEQPNDLNDTTSSETNQPNGQEYKLSDEVDEYGNHYVLSSDNSTDFGIIDEESGLLSAPIKLSLGDNTVDDKGVNHGYGLLHIEAERGKAIRDAGYNSVQDFVESVAKNYTDIREGGIIANNQTYLLELIDDHNNTLYIQLSKNGKYWTINSAGIFRKKYSRNKRKVYDRPALSSDTNTNTSGVNSGNTEGVTTPAGNSPKTSTPKGTELVSNNQENKEENTEKVEEKQSITEETTEETPTESLGEENTTEETRQRVTEEGQPQVAPMQLSESDQRAIRAEATRIEKGIRKMARELRKEWKGKDIYILEDMTDVFQRKFRQQIKENGLIGAIALNAKEVETAKQTLKRMLSPKFRGIFDGMNGEEIITSFSSHGFFKESTGKVYVNMSANLNAEDLKVTLFHEAVAHKGLRELLGKDNFNRLCQAVAEAMPTEIKERLTKAYSESGSTITDALIADEYMASLAEQMAENNGELTIPQRIVGAMRNFFRNLFNLKLNEADIKYLLYASYKKLKGDEDIQTSINNSATLKRLRDVAVTQQAEEAVRNRLVYHGSGAEFERFDHNYMGTGEGAQAYGWGTYVTDVEGIGRTYATTMRDNLISEKHKENAIINKLAKETLESNNGDKEEALNYLRSLLNEDWSDKKRVKAQIKIIETGKFLPESKQKAQLYNVDIPDDNGTNYIHWETNTQELADKLNDAYRTMLIKEKGVKEEDINPDFAPFGKGVSGGTIYNLFARELRGDKQASQFLSSLGFVGISYPAQATKGGRADGARNFVIFNEDDAQIVEHTRFRMSSTPEEFEAIQKQAVAENGIVMPNLNQMRVKVVDVPEHDFKGTLKQARNEAKQWATENYTDKEFDLPEEGGKYVISKRAINKYLDETAIAKSDNASIHLSTLKRLPEIISESVDVEIHPDYKKGENKLRSIDNGVGNPDLLVHRMYGAIEIGENTYRVKTTMHEFKNKNFATTPHSYEVTKIELIESPTTDESNSPLDVSTNSITATKLLQGVEKSYDKGKKVLEESKNTNPNIRFRINEELDEPYFNAIERGDMEEIERLVNEAARNAGYDSLSDYQGSLAFNGAAPSSNAYYTTKEERKEAWENGNFEGDMSLGDYADNNIDTHDLGWILTDPRALMNEPNATRESIYNLRNTIREGKRTIKMYRAVDAKIKEESFRNGDWITPSREYAQYHITLQDWDKGRIIEQEVSIDDIWWNGDDINEWGYDDGKEYAYKNTKNNRKSTDLITYDDNGDIIPLSKRFNYRNSDIRFRFGGNSGYVGYSMSVRAAQAREEGRYPKTDFLKEYGVSAKALQPLVDAEIISDREWHHTSKFGNKTTFYGWNEEEYADIYQDNKKEIDNLLKLGEAENVKSIFDTKLQEYIDAKAEAQAKYMNEVKEYGKYRRENLWIPEEEYQAQNGVKIVTNGSDSPADWTYLYNNKPAFKNYASKAREELEKVIKEKNSGILSFKDWKSQQANEDGVRFSLGEKDKFYHGLYRKDRKINNFSLTIPEKVAIRKYIMSLPENTDDSQPLYFENNGYIYKINTLLSQFEDNLIDGDGFEIMDKLNLNNLIDGKTKSIRKGFKTNRTISRLIEEIKSSRRSDLGDIHNSAETTSTTHFDGLVSGRIGEEDTIGSRDSGESIQDSRDREITPFDSEAGVNFRLSEETDNILSRIEQESSQDGVRFSLGGNKKSPKTATQKNSVIATAISSDFTAKINNLKERYKNRHTKKQRYIHGNIKIFSSPLHFNLFICCNFTQYLKLCNNG